MSATDSVRYLEILPRNIYNRKSVVSLTGQSRVVIRKRQEPLVHVFGSRGENLGRRGFRALQTRFWFLFYDTGGRRGRLRCGSRLTVTFHVQINRPIACWQQERGRVH